MMWFKKTNKSILIKGKLLVFRVTLIFKSQYRSIKYNIVVLNLIKRYYAQYYFADCTTSSISR